MILHDPQFIIVSHMYQWSLHLSDTEDAVYCGVE